MPEDGLNANPFLLNTFILLQLRWNLKRLGSTLLQASPSKTGMKSKKTLYKDTKSENTRKKSPKPHHVGSSTPHIIYLNTKTIYSIPH